MTALYLGLILFFGLHFYSAFRARGPEDIKARIGEGRYMGIYSLVSLVGFGLIIFGYVTTPAREILYSPPLWGRTVLWVTMFIASILIVSAYVPANRVKQTVRHPMVLALTLWAGSHLLMPTDSKEAWLFGSFFVFGIVDMVMAFRRPFESSGPVKARNTALVYIGGIVVFLVLFLWAHTAIIGVSPY